MAATFLDQLLADIKEAMKAKDADRLVALRTLHAAIKDQTVNAGKEATDEAVAAIVTRAIKQRLDASEQFSAAGRTDLVTKEQAEIELFRKYQPRQLDAGEIERLVRQSIAESGAATKKDMGKVMKVLMPKLKGAADGKVVNQIVQSLLP
jgi:uncharacterized protein YqeY